MRLLAFQVSLLFVVFPCRFSSGFSNYRPFTLTPRWTAPSPGPRRTETKLDSKRKLPERAFEETRQASIRFGAGVADVVCRYWEHLSRQAAVGLVTFWLVRAAIGMPGAKPLVMFLESFSWNYFLNCWLYYVWIAMEKVASCVVHREHDWHGLAVGLVGAPIAEEILYRLCILQGLTCLFQKLHSPVDDKENMGNNDESYQRLLSPWSIITSLAFAAGHIDYEMMWSVEYLSQHSHGRLGLARNLKLIVEAFFGSLFLMNPLYERKGLFCSIGAHFAWNACVFFPPLGDALIGLHFAIHMYQVLGSTMLKLPFVQRTSRGNTLPWGASPLQALCEISLTVRILFEWLYSW